MILTHGEKMVWAAAFVQTVMSLPGSRINFKTSTDEKHFLCTEAERAVRQMRDCTNAFDDAMSEDEEVVAMLRAMLGEEE